MDKSNKATNVLNHCPVVQEEDDSVCESEDYETIWYVTICNDLHDILNTERQEQECQEVPSSIS